MTDQASIDTLLRVRDRHLKKLVDLQHIAGTTIEEPVRKEEDAIATIARAIEFMRDKSKSAS